MIPLPEPDGVMGAVWALVRGGPNFDGRDKDVIAAVKAYATRYADVVRADEREKWISGVKISIPTEAMEREIDAHVRRAVAKERERCADICNRAMPQPVMNWCDAQMVDALRQCAEAIRNYRAQDKAV